MQMVHLHKELTPMVLLCCICMQKRRARAWIHAKSHRLCFPAVRSPYPHMEEENGFLIVMLFLTLPRRLLVVFIQPVKKVGDSGTC